MTERKGDLSIGVFLVFMYIKSSLNTSLRRAPHPVDHHEHVDVFGCAPGLVLLTKSYFSAFSLIFLGGALEKRKRGGTQNHRRPFGL